MEDYRFFFKFLYVLERKFFKLNESGIYSIDNIGKLLVSLLGILVFVNIVYKIYMGI